MSVRLMCAVHRGREAAVQIRRLTDDNVWTLCGECLRDFCNTLYEGALSEAVKGVMKHVPSQPEGEEA